MVSRLASWRCLSSAPPPLQLLRCCASHLPPPPYPRYSDGWFYCGETDDVRKRVQSHRTRVKANTSKGSEQGGRGGHAVW